MTTFSHTSNSNRSRSTVRLPVTSNEHIDLFKGVDISSYSGLIYNGIIDTYSNEDRKYVTERPAVKFTQDASLTVSKAKGRGIYYWAANNTTYIVNDDTVYKGNYNIPCSVANVAGTDQTSLISGTEKVYFQEWSSAYNDYLFIINPESSQVFIIQKTSVVTATSGTLGDDDIINVVDVISGISVSGTGDPFHASEAFDFSGLEDAINAGLCHGAVSLDQYLFLGTKPGQIYNSNVDNWLSWDSLDFTTAERENDQLLYIEKTKDHIAVFGERSIELFYDRANPTGSPLSVRTDIAYRTGILSGQTAWANGDDIYFIGMKPAGDFSVYTLSDFQLKVDSSSTIDSYIRHGRTEVTITSVASGFATGGHTFFIVTLFNSSNVPQKSLVFDPYSSAWYEWDTTLNTRFPVTGWTIRTPETPVTAQGIMSNGDIFNIEDNFKPIDSYGSSDYYFESDYLLDSGVAGDYLEDYSVGIIKANIPMKIIIDNFSGLSSELKFMHSIKYAGSTTQNSQNLIIEWSDDEGTTWYSDIINIKERTQINRLGSFVRRRFRLNYSGNEQIRIEALDATYTQGG